MAPATGAFLGSMPCSAALCAWSTAPVNPVDDPATGAFLGSMAPSSVSSSDLACDALPLVGPLPVACRGTTPLLKVAGVC